MRRADVVLAILASAEGQPLTPVQLQKAAFLLDRNLPDLIDDGPTFHFEPYDYGPFDKAVYDEASQLAFRGLAQISHAQWGRWYLYQASPHGLESGNALLRQLPENIFSYIENVTSWVRSQSFASLVKSIYDQYPEMRANSIFQG